MPPLVAGRPLRIGYLVSTFNFGGLERCAAWLVNHVDRSRFEPMVICLSRCGDAARWIEDPNVPLIDIGQRKGNNPTTVWKLARILRSYRLDLVHSHNWGTLVETALARRLGGMPRHLHAEHGLEVSDLEAHPVRMKLRGLATRWALGTADAVVAVAESLRRRIEERSGFAARRIQVIPNGVEVAAPEHLGQQAREIRRSLGISPESLVFGSMGRLAPVKNFGMAVEALNQLVARGLDAHCILIGDGPLRNELRREADALGLSNRVHLAGQQDAICPWLAALDVYVNSSVSEAMSLSIMEAMAVGRPCVVTDVGANAELVGGTGGCGLIIPPGDASAMARAIQQLATAPELRRQFGFQALERHVVRHSIREMVRRYEEAYEAICSLPRAKRREQT